MIDIQVVDKLMTPAFATRVRADYLVAYGNKLFVIGDKRCMKWNDFAAMMNEFIIS